MDLMDIDYQQLRLEDSPPGSTPRRAPDISLLKSLVPEFRYTTLATGLYHTIESRKNGIEN